MGEARVDWGHLGRFVSVGSSYWAAADSVSPAIRTQARQPRRQNERPNSMPCRSFAEDTMENRQSQPLVLKMHDVSAQFLVIATAHTAVNMP